MSQDPFPLPCLIGAGGQVGRRLTRAFAATRHGWIGLSRSGTEPAWSMEGPPPDLPESRGRAVFVLAGAIPGTGRAMALNTTLAQAGVAAARHWGAAHAFVVSSSSVYGPTGADPVDETSPIDPRSDYARAKLAMERATAAPDVTVLRLANVAGASQPFLALERPEAVTLDRFADGHGPRRSYVGPVTLARIVRALAALAERGASLPPLLNVAAPGEIAMDDILRAAGRRFAWRDAPPSAVAHVHLDVARLRALVPLDPQDAAALLAESHATDPIR